MNATKQYIALSAACALLVLFSLQYPLQTTFPIGGDAVRVIARAQEATQQPSLVLTNSNYPASIAAVASSVVIPISWSERFVALMVIGYIATGLAFGWLLWRHFGWREAALGIAAWGLVTTGVTRHFEDATLAQLLSLPAVLLCLDSLSRGRTWLPLCFLVVAGTFHPFSLLILGATLLLPTVWSWFSWRQLDKNGRWRVVVWSLTLASLGVALVATRGRSFWDTAFDHSLDLVHLAQTHFVPFMVLAPFGFLLIIWRYKERTKMVLTLSSFIAMSALFSLTHVGGLSPIPHRFDSYALLSMLLGAAVALPWLTSRLFVSAWSRTVFVTVAITTVSFASWQANAFVYDFYESPGKYARLHNDERAAILWLRDNISRDAKVASTTTNRHSEWIPVLSNRAWIQVGSVEALTNQEEATHSIFFLNREDVPEVLAEVIPLFENDGAVVFAQDQGAPQ